MTTKELERAYADWWLVWIEEVYGRGQDAKVWPRGRFDKNDGGDS